MLWVSWDFASVKESVGGKRRRKQTLKEQEHANWKLPTYFWKAPKFWWLFKYVFINISINYTNLLLKMHCRPQCPWQKKEVEACFGCCCSLHLPTCLLHTHTPTTITQQRKEMISGQICSQWRLKLRKGRFALEKLVSPPPPTHVSWIELSFTLPFESHWGQIDSYVKWVYHVQQYMLKKSGAVGGGKGAGTDEMRSRMPCFVCVRSFFRPPIVVFLLLVFLLLPPFRFVSFPHLLAMEEEEEERRNS